MIRIAPEGRPFIIGAWIIAAALFLLVPWPLAALWLPIPIWVVAFFRDPVRDGPRGDRLVIAPADGLVVSIVNIDEPVYIQGRATRISIFMNVFNVHVNRYPVSGKVAYVHYNRGKFLNAAADKASLENEQMSVGVQQGRRRVLFRQIAGLIARRIVTYSRVGDDAEQGERMGLIRFGSRVDVFVPVGSTVRVKLGDKPVAGTTVLAELPQ